jgi:hypothetical protein
VVQAQAPEAQRPEVNVAELIEQERDRWPLSGDAY